MINSSAGVNPLGPIQQKFILPSRVMHSLTPLCTLLSPPGTQAKLAHFLSTFLTASYNMSAK